MAIATEAFRVQADLEAFPETLFLDRQGRIAHRLTGGQEAPYFAAQLDRLLAETESGAAEFTSSPEVDSVPAVATAQKEADGHTPLARVVYWFMRRGHREKSAGPEAGESDVPGDGTPLSP